MANGAGTGGVPRFSTEVAAPGNGPDFQVFDNIVFFSIGVSARPLR
jgi:hypothetical protein